jgi:tRNA (guanine-N7-)-methyltransferase
VKLLNHYVDKEISQVIPKYSIPVIYIQHPDPWPKRRHHKYRLINQDFIDALNLMLELGGRVEIATDHPEYSQWIIEHFDQRKDFVSLFEKGYTYEKQAGHIETYFEEIKRAEGFEPIFMFYQKVK